MDNLPPLWTPHYNMPSREALAVLFMFDLLFLLSIYIFYKLSIDKYGVDLSFRNLRNHVITPKTIYTGIKFAYLGIFLITLSNTISHLVTLIYYQDAYFMIGFESGIFMGPGMGTIIYGVISFHRYYSIVTYSEQETKYLAVLLSLLPIVGIILAIFAIFEDFTDRFLYIFKIAFGIYTLMFLISWILLAIYYNQNADTANKLIIYRRSLVGISIFLLFLFVGLSYIFIPGDVPETEYLTRNPELEYLLLGINIIMLLLSISLYLLISIPKWARRVFDIDEDLYRDLIAGFHGKLDDNTIVVDLEDYEEPKIDINFNDGGVVFLDFEGIDLSKEISEILETKPEIIKTFNLNEIASEALNAIGNKSNLVFVSTAMSNRIMDLLDDVADDYSWEIDPDLDKITINGVKYHGEDKEFGVIIGLPSYWSENHQVYIYLFREALTDTVIEFYNDFGNFIDSISLPFLMVVIFDVVDDEIQNIMSDTNNPSKPHQDSYYLL